MSVVVAETIVPELRVCLRPVVESEGGGEEEVEDAVLETGDTGHRVAVVRRNLATHSGFFK